MLLRKTDILTDESLSSYIFRLSKFNYYDSPSIIYKGIGLTYYHFNKNTIPFNNCEKLSELTNLPTLKLYNQSILSYIDGYEIMRKTNLVLGKGIKYCPKCIEEVTYQKIPWNFLHLHLCIEHSCLLISSCYNCNRSLRLIDLMSGKCIFCGTMLAEQKTMPIPSSSIIYESQSDLYRRILYKEVNFMEELSVFQYIQLNITSQVLLKKSRNLFNEDTDYLLDNNHTKSVIESLKSFATIYWMYRNLDNNLPIVLDQFNANFSYEKKIGKRKFEKILIDPNLNFLRMAYLNYKENQIRLGNTSRNIEAFDKGATEIRRQNFFTKKEILNFFPITRKQLENMCSLDLLPFKEKTEGVHRKLRIFDINLTTVAINTFIQERKNYLTIAEASTKLGISVGCIQDLVREKILDLKVDRIRNRSFLFALQVNELLKVDSISNEKLSSLKVLGFKQILNKYVTSGLSIVKILTFIEEGKLKPFCNLLNPKLSDFLFGEEEIKSCLILLKKLDEENKGLEFGTVARELCVGERTLHKIIGAGLISPKYISLFDKGKKEYRFISSDIKKFKEQFLFVSDAAILLNLSENDVRKIIRENNIENILKDVSSKILIKKVELLKIYST